MNNQKNEVNRNVMLGSVVVIALVSFVLSFLKVEITYSTGSFLNIVTTNPFELILDVKAFGVLNLVSNLILLLVPISLVAAIVYYSFKKDIRVLYVPIVLQLVTYVLVVVNAMLFYKEYGYTHTYTTQTIMYGLILILVSLLLGVALYQTENGKGKLYVYFAILPAFVAYLNSLLNALTSTSHTSTINLFLQIALLIGAYAFIVSTLNTHSVSIKEQVKSLKDLAHLKDQGVITPEEFELKKQELLVRTNMFRQARLWK